MLKKIILVVLFYVFCLIGHTHAYELTVTGASIAVSYTEPTTSTDGSPLNDLDRTEISTNIPSFLIIPVPATSKSGGGIIKKDIRVAIPQGTMANIEVSVEAIDIAGNRSEKATKIITIDKLPPSPVR